MVDRYTYLQPALKSITKMGMFCPVCNWTGLVEETEPDIDGDGSLGCPNCYAVVEPNKEHTLYLDYTKKAAGAFDQWQEMKRVAEEEYKQAIQDAIEWYETEIKRLNK